MADTYDADQYKDSRNLKARGNLHARYANRNWFDWVADHLCLSPNSDVIDIGCGTGWFWSSVVGHLPGDLRLTLVDISEGMVTEAVQHLSPNRHFGGIAGQTADAAALPSADRTFDAAIAMHMLYHVPVPETAIDEMARVLRPDGLAAITTNGDANLGELFDLGSEALGGAASDPAALAFGAASAQTLLARRFDTVTVHMFEDIYAIDAAEDIFRYLTSFPPGIHASEEQKQALHLLIAERLGRNNGVLKVKREGALICAR